MVYWNESMQRKSWHIDMDVFVQKLFFGIIGNFSQKKLKRHIKNEWALTWNVHWHQSQVSDISYNYIFSGLISFQLIIYLFCSIIYFSPCHCNCWLFPPCTPQNSLKPFLVIENPKMTPMSLLLAELLTGADLKMPPTFQSTILMHHHKPQLVWICTTGIPQLRPPISIHTGHKKHFASPHIPGPTLSQTYT